MFVAGQVYTVKVNEKAKNVSPRVWYHHRVGETFKVKVCEQEDEHSEEALVSYENLLERIERFNFDTDWFHGMETNTPDSVDEGDKLYIAMEVVDVIDDAYERAMSII